jgi:serine protease Do
MATQRKRPFLLSFRRPLFAILVSCLAAGLALPALADAPAKSIHERLAPVVTKSVPETVDDLRTIQEQVKAVLKRVLPCTVCVRIGPGQGSGVLISADGYVLTAGHVAGQPDRKATIILPDGRQLKGKTLGMNRQIDSGLVKITEDGKWPFLEMGKSTQIKAGQWCIAIGHPGGYRPGRTPVVRVGRVLEQTDDYVRTDCTLVGGDSGGPLVDLQGKVIGIHSRIGNSLTWNVHVPVDTYRDSWERLAKGESWGGRLGSKGDAEPFLGVQGDTDASECRLIRILPGSPAEKAGLKENDVVTRFGTKVINNYDELVAQIARRRPGDEVTLDVLRGEDSVTVRVVIGKREG